MYHSKHNYVPTLFFLFFWPSTSTFLPSSFIPYTILIKINLFIIYIYSSSPYLDEGFMHLQRIVSEGIIHYKTGQAVAVNVESRVSLLL